MLLITLETYVNVDTNANCRCLFLCLILVSGGYTPWGDWEECSVTCGAGSQSRSRSCTDPSPEHGGPTCLEQGLGEATESQACNADPCPGSLLHQN